MEIPAFDPIRALSTLDAHGVRFVVIGGFAAQIHGSPSMTNDIDVCYARDEENLQRLAAALIELGARLRGAPEDVPFLLDAKTLEMGGNFTFLTNSGGLDCIGFPAGTKGFEDLELNASEVDLDGLTVRVASIDELIRMKQAAGRPKDLIEVEVLGALREEMDTER